MGSDGGILMSFEELITRYDIPDKHQFKYLQVRNFIRSSQKNVFVDPPVVYFGNGNEKRLLWKGNYLQTI